MPPMPRRLTLVTLLPFVVATAHAATREDAAPVEGRSDVYYVGLLGTTLNHRKVGALDDATWSSAGTLVAGSYLTDLFHAEFRAGKGLRGGNVTPDFTLNIDYFASWYIGLQYPLTPYAHVYGQFGFSYIQGTAQLRNSGADRNRPYRNINNHYPESAFSVSWITGIDLEVINNTYLVLEGGRLFKDTGSRADTFQFSSGIRYEF